MKEQPILFNTPTHPSTNLSRRLGIDLYIKRDDYLPSPGGGNKVRKLRYIFHRMIPESVDTLVTHGGLQSNHARVMALEAARRNLKSHIVLHCNRPTDYAMSGNALLMKLAGAEISVVAYDHMWDAVQQTMEKLRKHERIPFFVPGGAHCVEGAWSYADAVEELRMQLPDQWVPDFIIHASGTGATQAGIIVGVELAHWPTTVIGISVGRVASKGKAVVEDLYRELREYFGFREPGRKVNFRDEWLCGGYERFDQEIIDTIKLAAQMDGIVLDLTYTGKAFTGLVNLVASGEIPQNSRVLFWHTGGLLNLMTSDRFAFEAIPALQESQRK